ncbi:mitochondrial carrier [Multifurca ochricompacta]|uniref:Mitochondrial glycine transporter n=1 Tax=Multifurca ochricompacta TaxID=376703 RepID=A0AAD4LYE5_9AGAM|nr:mitochondrial carrier [Multifurca ochricompacta]
MSNVSQHLLSGALSGLTSSLFLQPFDLIKTRLQQGDPSLKTTQAGTIRSITRAIVSSSGVFGLWRGTSATLIRNVPGISFYMTGLNQVRGFMSVSPLFATVRKRDSEKHSSVLPVLTNSGNLLAGATTRVAVGFVLNPFSVLKARYESNLHNYASLMSSVRSIIRAGPSDLFRGFLASSLRDAPNAGLFLVLYEGIKHEAGSLIPSSSPLVLAALHSGSGAAAGTIATLATHPFDVIKTRLQVRTEEKYHGLTRTVLTVWNERGIYGFFDGASLRLSRKILSSAIGWAVYESLLLFARTNSLKEVA